MKFTASLPDPFSLRCSPPLPKQSESILSLHIIGIFNSLSFVRRFLNVMLALSVRMVGQDIMKLHSGCLSAT